MLTGVDVSHHQGTIDWTRVAAAGHDFAICKVSQGLGFADGRWRANLAGLRRTLLVGGGYHFLERGDGAAQARRFRSLLGDPAGLLAALDAETPGAKADPAYADVNAFCGEWYRITRGHPLLVYTGRWWWVGHLGDPPKPPLTAGLWNSQYNDKPFDPYGGWAAETIRQYTSAGQVPGVAGACDVNRFAGTLDGLRALTRPTEGLSMADAQAILDKLQRLREDLTVRGTTGLEQTVEHFADRQRKTGAALSRLEAAVEVLEGKVDKIGEPLPIQVGLSAEQVDLLAKLLAGYQQLAGFPTLTAAQAGLLSQFLATLTGETAPKGAT